MTTGSTSFHRLALLAACIATSVLAVANAAEPHAFRGLWMTAAEDAVIEFQACADKPTALCGRIVWDKDAGTPQASCGVLITQLDRHDGEAWRDGWVFDPRDKKTYKGALRLKGGELHLRAYVGTELLGQAERLRRVEAMPPKPACPKG